MELPPKKIIDQLRSVALSDTERAALRANLIAHIHENKVQHAVLSPWTQFILSKHAQAVFLSIIIIVSYGSSITSAAEGTLPGDILYPVKTGVIEPVARLVSASSPSSEASFETKLLEKRLEEVEILTAKKNLDPALKQVVRAAIYEQNVKADKKIESIKNIRMGSSSRIERFTTENSTSSAENLSKKNNSRGNSGDDEDDERENDNERVLKEVRKKYKNTFDKLDLRDSNEEKEKDDDKNED